MKTIINLFEGSVKKFSDNPYIWEKDHESYKATNFSETQKEVYELAAGLLSIGIKKHDKVALLSEGRKYWVITELAILYTGAVNVPLSIKLDGPDLYFRLEHSETKLLFVSASQAHKIKDLQAKLPNLKLIVYLDQKMNFSENEIHISTLIEKGKQFLITNYNDLVEAYQAIGPNDYATISYTSGTTADPKGVILSHRNYTANVEQALTLMDVPSYFRTLIILPLDHCFAHVAGLYSFMAMGASIGMVQQGKTPMDTLKNIPINIKELKPHVMLSVPALAKNFKKNIETGIRAKGKFTEFLFKNALNLSYKYNKEGFNKAKGLSILYKPLLLLYDKILFSKIRNVFGGEMQFFIGGGALLDIELQRFFYAIGIPMFQGYGLSEATPIISSNSLKKHKLGSSGYLVTPLELKICDDKGNSLPTGQKGEIVIQGENVMQGYWKNEKSTSETLKNGWLHTGDMGYMDSDGFLYVLGRFKSLLIGSDGEKYSPEGIEEALIQHSKYIEQIILYNNQNTYTIALIVPSKEAIKRTLRDVPSMNIANDAINLITNDISKFKMGGEFANQFPDRWLPSTFAVLEEPFTEQNGMINSTLKVVRGNVEKHYQHKIDYLYTPEGKNILSTMNIDAMLQVINS